MMIGKGKGAVTCGCLVWGDCLTFKSKISKNEKSQRETGDERNPAGVNLGNRFRYRTKMKKKCVERRETIGMVSTIQYLATGATK